MMTGRQVRQSRQRLLNRLTSRSAGRSQGRRKPARAAREPLTACPRTGYLTHYSQPDTEQPYSLSDRVLSFTDDDYAEQSRCNFKMLWVRQTSAHSPWTLAKPRKRNWRNPRACLIWPKTGSTMVFRVA